MKVLSVVGARPQFVKLAPVAKAFAENGLSHVVVHTGQHYDHNMSDSFFDTLSIPDPDYNLDVGSGGHGLQTGTMLTRLEPVLIKELPDWVLVYGDTNSTLAAAICAAKLNLPLAHLESGLRSFNRRMPEEHNRVLTDHSSDLCLAPTKVAMGNLASEGLAARSRLVGDVMIDVLLAVADSVRASPVQLPFDDTQPFVLATLHRAENTDSPDKLRSILGTLASLPTRVVLAAHPRLVSRCSEFGIALDYPSVDVVEPLSYPQTVQALLSAAAVITDSGGLQKEAHCLGVPTTTVRAETEWVETLAGQWNVLATTHHQLLSAATRACPTMPRGMPFGDGTAARVVAEALAVATPGATE